MNNTNTSRNMLSCNLISGAIKSREEEENILLDAYNL